jgi:catechol 2,3-dioxygenase-like lactoylglutathione lyase family enzyme
MINGLDHLGLYVRDLERSVADLTALFGRPPEWRGEMGDHRHAWFQLSNVALDVIAPEGGSPAAEKTRAYIAEHGEGIWGLGFAVADLNGASRVLARRGLDMQPIATSRSRNEAGEEREWRLAMARPKTTNGLVQFFVEQPGGIASSRPATNSDPFQGLDHVVINTANPDRALAFYGGRLGLDLKLDRSNPDWNSRLMFFRCGDLVVEVGARLDRPIGNEPDRPGGLAWRVADAPAVHRRLADEGFDISGLRPGRKPGTQVFTVRNRTASVPTLVIEQGKEPARA